MAERILKVSVHERLDTPGFVVVVQETDGTKVRTVRFPAPTYDEGALLAASIQRLASVPGGVDALYPDEDG